MTPVDPAARIIEADIVRGFALFGVLLLNMYGFGADSIAWDSSIDRLAFGITHVFFDSKSWTLFSVLFGFGFALQMQRANERGKPFFTTYIRRLAALFAFGAINTLLHDGDILVLYAELGLVLLLFYRLPTRWLLVITAGLMLVFPLSHLATPERDAELWGHTDSLATARAELDLNRQEHVFVTGSIMEIARYNAPLITSNPFEDYNWADSSLTVFAMMLLGFTIGRSGVMANVAGNLVLIRRVRNWGLGCGIAAMAAEQLLASMAGYAVFRPATATPGLILAGDFLFAFGTVALAFGYAATLIIAAQTRKGRVALAPLSAVGRMALTVYLSQTVIFTTVFYGYGFDAAFRTPPATVTAWAVIIFIVQVLACQWWLHRYRFGPVEWLWRSFTYLEWQPLRLK